MGTYTSHARLRLEPRSHRPSQGHTRHVTLVWIDAREAVIASWSGGAADLKHLGSDVPARHRSTGHVRHRPAVRHGGGGVSESALERHREEHLARFIEQVARRLPDDEDVVILFSIRSNGGTCYELLDDQGKIISTLGFDDFKNIYAASAANNE